jgi:hypothetical protein
MAQIAIDTLKLTTRNKSAQERSFRSFFGAPIEVVCDIWNRLTNLKPAAKPKHLLWSLVFIKSYVIEYRNSDLHASL